MNELSEFVGGKIKSFRKDKGLTQKELGEKIGVKHNTISAYERGTISPEQDMLFALSRALEVSIDDFFPTRNKTDDLQRALEMTDNLNLEDMNFLNELIKKALTMSETEREEFLKSIRFTVEYHDKMHRK